VIVTGGGTTARKYIKPLAKDKQSRYVLDTMGIEATRLNAKLVASFLKNCNQEIPTSLAEVKKLIQKHKVVITGGLEPGTTSDGTTAMIAEKLKAKTLINMTNVSRLYTKDPRKFKDAKFIGKLSHADFKKMIDKVESKPGQHFVLDALAANIARKAKIEVVIMKGMNNLDKFLTGEKFKGTLIS
jgi:uridylate kinase